MSLSPLMALPTLGSVLAIALALPASATTVYTGELKPGDAIFAYDGSLYDDYAIQGEAGTQMTVQLRSNEFDPFLAIVGTQGEWLQQNNDISSTNHNASLSFTFPDDEVYYVFVNAYSSRGQGAYTLNMWVDRTNSSSNDVIVPSNPMSMPHPLVISAGNSSPVNSSNYIEIADNSSGLTQSQQQRLLDIHNRYRAEVNVPDLVWSDEVARSAKEWADHLAANNAFGHSSSSYGENLWTGTAGAFSLEEMVSGWGEEKEFFISNAAFPNVSTTGNWADVGHYTQLVWKDTTAVGCAITTGNGRDTLVCQYNPPGNYQGEMPF